MTGRIRTSTATQVLVALATLVGTAASARAEIIYSGTSDGAWQSGAASTRLAQTFRTGATPLTLDEVSVWMRNANATNNSSSAGTLALLLYATDGEKKPTGSSLLTIVNNTSIGPWSDGWITGSSLGYSLSANTDYAVVFAASAGSTISWKYNNSTPITSSISPTPTFYNWQSADDGATWSDASPTLGFNMVVQATASGVPEIDVAGLVCIVPLVAGVFGLLERRRLKAA